MALAAAGMALMLVVAPAGAAPAGNHGEDGGSVKAASGETAPVAGGAESPSPDDLIRNGEICLDNGDAGRARDLFEEALRLRPDDPRALLGLGRALTARRRYVEADALFRDMEERHIAALEARLGRARLRSLQGDHEGARRFYRDVMQAEPGNVEARLGMIREAHIQGLDAQAVPQVDSLVLDHPENEAARTLQKTVHDDLDPRITITPIVQDDDAGNRRGQTEVAGTFMAEPQTAVSVALTGVHTTSECGGAVDCAALVTTPPEDGRVDTDARTLVAGTVIRVIRPLTFEARVGAFQEDPIEGGRRTLIFGDGVIRWEAGPKLTLRGRTARRPLFDSAALVDWGVHVDTGDLLLEYRLHPLWTVAGTGELGRYSDGNARECAELTLAFQAPITRPSVTTTAMVRLRRHHDDRDMGYLDPIRYDSEMVTVALADAILDGKVRWSIEGTYGRQAYDENNQERAAVAPPDAPIAGGAARLDFALGDRVDIEAWHRRTNDAITTAPGFPVRISGLALKIRL